MQIYRSSSLEGLDYQSRYGLDDYTDSLKPLVIFGMYNRKDYKVLCRHKGEVIVVWQGMDAKYIPTDWHEKLKSVKNIAISKWISDSLLNYNIHHSIKYISATKPIANNYKNGDAVYFYSSNLSQDSANYHGEYMLNEIRERTGLEIIRATYSTFSKDELQEVYKRCFLNLRLTQYDGCPNTNLEMGLMGRKSIFNGNLPHSIKWKTVDDICESIMREYRHRHQDNLHITNDFLNFINGNNLQ